MLRLQRAANAYVGKLDRTDSRLSPLFMDANLLKVLPPTLLQVYSDAAELNSLPARMRA